MARVSVIVPVYNAEKYLKKCLESVCNQTLKDFEIICVNDCSTDDSLSILNQYAENDSRIKVIDFKENKGVSVARNTGIELSTGEFIGFLDADDFIDLNFYEILYNKSIETNADVVKGNIARVDEDYAKLPVAISIDLNSSVKTHKAYFHCIFTTGIYRRSIVLDNNIKFLEEVSCFEDPYFIIKLMPHINNVAVVDSANYYYLSNPNSQTNKKITTLVINDISYCALEILKYFREINLDKDHYSIVFSYLFGELEGFANEIQTANDINIAASKGLSDLLKESMYLEDCLVFHFLVKKEKAKKAWFASLRSSLNESRGKADD